MAYNPDSNKAIVMQDLQSTETGKSGSFRSNDGSTGPIGFPNSAELIFPDLDSASDDERGSEGGMGSSFSKKLESLSSRQDIKAQKKYVSFVSHSML